MVDTLLYALFAVLAIFIISTVLGSFFSVRTQTAAVIERFGKFNRVAEPGLNFKLPFVETKNEVSLVTFQLEGSIETKTKDNVFVQLPVKVQYRIIDTPQSIKDAYYKLANPKSQIESYLYNILLGSHSRDNAGRRFSESAGDCPARHRRIVCGDEGFWLRDRQGSDHGHYSQ